MSLALPTAKTEGHFATWQLVDNMDGLLTGGEVRIARGTVMPMNSKHLAKTYLSQVAEKLELPMKASAEEMKQIIEGKLAMQHSDRT